MRPWLLLLAASLPAQQAPHADELAGIRFLQLMLARAASDDIEIPDPVPAGYDTQLFVDEERAPRKTRRDRTTAIVLRPRSDADGSRRLLLGIRGGRVLAGKPAAARDFRPTLATIAARGARLHVNDMVLGQGFGQDGTAWQRLCLDPQPQRIRVVDQDGAPIPGVQVEIGGSRFAWHPAWLDVAGFAVHGCTAVTDARGEAEARGVHATALRLRLALDPDTGHGKAAVLTRDMIEVDGNLLTVRVPRRAFVDEVLLQEQAWAVLALRRLHREQVQFREQGRIDEDGDRLGEFGPPRKVLPVDVLTEVSKQPGGVERFRRHLFTLYLPHDADGREQHFVAYAWPAASPATRAFAIDEHGVVHVCDGPAYQGLASTPGADVARTAGTGEPWLAPLADGQGRDGRLWRRL